MQDYTRFLPKSPEVVPERIEVSEELPITPEQVKESVASFAQVAQMVDQKIEQDSPELEKSTEFSEEGGE